MTYSTWWNAVQAMADILVQPMSSSFSETAFYLGLHGIRNGRHCARAAFFQGVLETDHVSRILAELPHY